MARVSKLTIKGYRSVGNRIEIVFPKNKPLVLVGENNGGKSNIIRALNQMLGQFSPAYHDPEDHEFYERDRSNVIDVAVHFDEQEPLADKWTEIRWVYDESKDRPSSLEGVWPGAFNTYLKSGERETCSCMLIDAERNLKYQLSYSSKYTFLSRMMRHFHKSLGNQEAIKKELRELFESTKSAFNKLPEFQTFVQSLQEGLSDLVDCMTHKLEVDFEAYNPVNFFHALDLRASENGEPRTLDEMGTGEQQVLAMAFVHAYAKAFHSGILLAIEEPEAHLHPLAQRWLASRLSNMCEEGLQVVITTHNPAFINMLDLEGLVVVTKDDGGTDVMQIDREELVEHRVSLGVPDGTITAGNVLPFYLANATREILEGFFAKLVVLVEGPTESLSLPIYLDRVGLDTAKHGIAVIPVHGKGNLGKWRRLFDAYDIPCYVIFDNDGAADDKKKTKRRDALSALGVEDEGEQDAYIQYDDLLILEKFAVFGSNFEEVLRGKFPSYGHVEEEGRESGVDSKPFLARYVAENIKKDKADGWKEVKSLANSLRELLP
jgi:putative ATP-dependent endonuclease of OLD family